MSGNGDHFLRVLGHLLREQSLLPEGVLDPSPAELLEGWQALCIRFNIPMDAYPRPSPLALPPQLLQRYDELHQEDEGLQQIKGDMIEAEQALNRRHRRREFKRLERMGKESARIHQALRDIYTHAPKIGPDGASPWIDRTLDQEIQVPNSQKVADQLNKEEMLEKQHKSLRVRGF